MTLFDRLYLRFIQFGLVLCIWFAAFAHAGYDLWAACCVFAWLTILALLLVLGHFRSRKTIRFPCILPATFLMMALAASAFRSYDVTTSVLETWMWFFCFVAFYLLMNTLESNGDLRTFLRLASGALIPLAVLCIAGQIGGHPEGYGHISIFGKPFRYGHWEIHATLINSIVMSGFALYWFFFLWEQKTSGSLQVLSLLSFFVVLTLGRSWWAFASFGLSQVYYFSESIKSIYMKWKFELIVVTILILIGSLTIVYFKFGPQQGQHYIGTNRFYWWLASLKMIGAHPLTGIGPGGFGTAYPYFRTMGIRNTLYAHSFPLQFAAEAGLLGLLSIGWLTRDILRRIRSSKGALIHSAPTPTALIATLVLALTYASINISLEYFLNKLVFFLILGCLVPHDPDDIKISPGLGSTATALFLILLVPLWVSPLQASRLYVSGFDQETQGQWAAARDCYADAIRIDRTYAEAYAGMARTYKKSFRQTRMDSDLVQWRYFLSQACRFKKDIHYISELNHSLEQ